MVGPRGPVGEKGALGDPVVQGDRGQQGVQGPPAGGAVYTHWGRTTCPTGQGTQLLDAGRAGGTHYQHQTIRACQMILTISSTRVEYKDMHILVEWSTDILDFHLSLLLTITMFSGPCAMWALEMWQ